MNHLLSTDSKTEDKPDLPVRNPGGHARMGGERVPLPEPR